MGLKRSSPRPAKPPPEAPMPETVGILGGGSWGSALADLVGRNGHTALHWMRDASAVVEMNDHHTNNRYLPGLALSPAVEATTELARIGRECRLVFVVVTSQSLR